MEERFDELPGLSGSKQERLETLIERVDRRIGECKLGKKAQRITDAETTLEEEHYEQAENAFEELLDELDGLDVDDRETIADLRDRARRGHLEARIEQVRRERDGAQRQFEAREYYEAREAFEDVREAIEPILSLATKYGFTDQKRNSSDSAGSAE